MIFVFSNAPMLTAPPQKNRRKAIAAFLLLGGITGVYAYFTTFTVFCEPSE